MVTEQVGQCPTRADGETRRAREVVLGDDGILDFVVLTNVDGGDPIHGGFDLISTGSTANSTQSLTCGDINTNLFRRYPKLCATISSEISNIPIIDSPVISPKRLWPHNNTDLARLPRLSGF